MMSYYQAALSTIIKASVKVLDVINNNPVYNDQTARLVFTAVGAFYAFSKVVPLTKTLLSVVHIPYNISERYGKGTWAVITGGSDGIGKEFAFQLASWGFNIVIIARNQEKLDKVAREIRHKYHDIKVKTIEVNFRDSYEEGFIEKIYGQISDLDISFLVNNVGLYPVKVYARLTIDEVREGVLINMLSHTLMTRAILPKMLSRKQRSAVINVSSFAAELKPPKVHLYSSTKAYIKYLSLGLTQEYPNIDFLAFKPNMISTKLTGYPTPLGIVVSQKDAVSSALGALGKVEESYGYWRHRMTAWGVLILPRYIQALIVEATH